jgi:hypothetical protein
MPNKGAPNQDPNTQEVMRVIERHRAGKLHSFETLARLIEDVGRDLYDRQEVQYEFKIRADQIRAMLQGMTKTVPLWVVMFCAHIYNINQNELFDFLGEY